MAEEMSREMENGQEEKDREEQKPSQSGRTEETGEQNEEPKDRREDAKAGEGQETDEPADCGDEDGADTAPEPDAGEEQDLAGEQEKTSARGKRDGFFKKKKDKRDEKIEELEDKLKRQMAEFENFRKRTEKEKSHMFDMGAKTIIEKVLPVVDNFERGLAAVPEDKRDDPFVTGMDKVYKQLMTEFEAIGVTAIEAVGKEFDPELHNAVMQTESDELESGVVAAELQKGYKYKDAVVRHSMVSVVS